MILASLRFMCVSLGVGLRQLERTRIIAEDPGP
jgi:hypothetical protein